MSLSECNKEQQDAITFTYNTVVAAGAGSGKTRVLAERFAWLLEEYNLEPEQIVTLTFTRKATAEMYERIYKQLAASTNPTTREKLSRFDTARILTLDAFCSGIVRGACQRYGLPPDFSMDEKRLEKVAEDCAIQCIMRHRDHPAMQMLIATWSFDVVKSDLLQHLGYHHISILPQTTFSESISRQISFYETTERELLQSCENLVQAICTVDLSEKARGMKSNIQGFFSAAYAKLQEPLTATEKHEILFQLIEHKLISSSVTDASMLEMREYQKEFKDLIQQLDLVHKSLRFKNVLPELAIVLDDYANSFREKKRSSGLLSFSDIAELAIDILRHDTQLRTYYKKAIRMVMIDEFQDNNILQKQLLYLVSEKDESCVEGIPNVEDLHPQKLFFVGDEKQSIYRFRGADVSVFRSLADELKSIASPEVPEFPVLSTNYRSAPALIDFFNAFFPGVFGDAEQLYEARFQAITAGQEIQNIDTPAVEFHILEKTTDMEDSISSSENEAIAAAQRICQGLENKEFKLDDIAILFKTTTHQAEWERVLRAFNLPFVCQEPRDMYRESVTNDLYAFLRLLLYPGDAHCFATTLRSPLVHLSDDSLSMIFLQNSKASMLQPPNKSLFQNQDDLKAWKQFLDIWEKLSEIIDIQGNAALLSLLWYDYGYRQKILSSSSTASYITHFNVLLDLARNADARNLCLSEFLQELAPLMGTNTRVQSTDAGIVPPGHLQISTIHKSKGLEYPIVIIPECSSEPNKEKNGSIYYMDKELGASINVKDPEEAKESIQNFLLARAKKQEEAETRAELRRLLYVAATRAERKLLFFMSIKPDKETKLIKNDCTTAEYSKALLCQRAYDTEGNEKQHTFSLLIAKSMSTVPENLYTIHSIPVLSWTDRLACIRHWRQQNSKIEDLPTIQNKLATAPMYGVPSFSAAPTSPSAMEQVYQEEMQASIIRELPSLPIDAAIKAAAAEDTFGILCHRAIEYYFQEKNQLSLLEAQTILTNTGLSEEHIREAHTCALSFMSQFLSSTIGTVALQSKRLRSEASFLLPIPSKRTKKPLLVNGVIDLFFETEKELIIVDFKTDHYILKGNHAVQMALYRKAARAFSTKPAISWLFYLRDASAVLEMTEFSDDILEVLGRSI